MIESRILTIAILFGLIFGSGFWLSRAGKPHNTLILTVHKLISVVAMVLLYLALGEVYRSAPAATGVLVSSIAAGVFFLASIITGGVVSATQAPSPVMTALHKYLPYLTLLATAATLYLLFIASRQMVVEL